jgi:multiphosphoryl transfer protein
VARHHQFVFQLPNGLHARPASHLAEVAQPFEAAITFVNERTRRSANVKSVLGLVGTDTRANDPCRLEIAGADEERALDTLCGFLSGDFVRCDEPLVVEAVVGDEVLIPRALRAAGLTRYHSGRIACRGLGQGCAVIIGGFELPADLSSNGPVDVAAERAKFEHAARGLAADYEEAANAACDAERGVLRAHLGILRDPTLIEDVIAQVAAGTTAGQALVNVLARHREILGAAQSAYIRERVADLEDIACRLLEKILGRSLAVAVPILAEPSVVFAENLTPSQFLALNRQHLAGLVLVHGGLTSHVVILARSFGIPTLTGVADATTSAEPDSDVIVDANVGIVVSELNDGVRRYYEGERAKLGRIAEALAVRRNENATTADGRRLEVAANIASSSEVTAAVASGAEAIGLFRTELMFANRATAPSEDEQYALYAEAVRAAAGRSVIIRTLDIGGDKPVPFLRFPTEANPFLGYRGVRFYAEHAPLIKTQLRALLRAAVHGSLKILVPMIACVEEARLVRRLLTEAREELQVAKRGFAEIVPLGFMLEVPSVAFVLDELCVEADFFSLGTNDLAQYFFAADRENPKVADLQSPFHPGFLRLLKHIVTAVHARGGWVGLCGELAENPVALPLLVGLGLDEISLAAPRIAATKATIAALEFERCEALLERAAAAATQADVRLILSGTQGIARPLFTPELVLDDVTGRTKAEVIREMVDALQIAGRTEQPTLVEEAVWQREETYSTGFGDGFALPHGKSDALTANSIVVARLPKSVDWQSLDGQPVDVVILLAIRESEHGRAHMEILARLSRLMMREEFRAAIRAQTSAARVVALLQQADQPLAAVPA